MVIPLASEDRCTVMVGGGSPAREEGDVIVHNLGKKLGVYLARPLRIMQAT